MLLFHQPTLFYDYGSVEGDVRIRGDNAQDQHIEDEGRL